MMLLFIFFLDCMSFLWNRFAFEAHFGRKRKKEKTIERGTHTHTDSREDKSLENLVVALC